MSRSIAIIGAGPCGLEAALYAKALGHRVVLYERERPGAHVRRWGFVRLFSPWKLNVSSLGLAALRAAGRAPPDPERCPTGTELVEEYLDPIARSLGDAVRTGVEVLSISKLGLLKGDNIGGKLRARAPFRLLLEHGGKEEEALGDIVLDATGVFAQPCHLGDGGIPALGEIAGRDAIRYHLPDPLGADRADLAGKTILLVGSGHSAATALLDLLALRREDAGTRILWARRSSGPDPLPVHRPDPLPERARLGEAANRIAAEPPEGCTVLSGIAVSRIRPDGPHRRVSFRPVDGGALPEEHIADRILALVGYRPSYEIHRELQVHQCYATEGPMSLAAALLAKGGGGDCLVQPSIGPDTLRNPEPGFFIIGHKAYGRRSDFVLQAGRDHVREVFRLIEEDPELDLYSPAQRATSGGVTAP